MCLIDSPESFDHDKPAMFRHLANLNEDASLYEWQGVRFWSEEVCARIADGKWSWDDDYRIDLLRIKYSQQKLLNTTSREYSQSEPSRKRSFDSKLDMNPEVRAAKPGPPCRPYNAGSCPFTDHHTQNGYRRLHICSHCIAQKCLPLPHSNDKCKSKVFTVGGKNPRPKDEPGFGK